MKSALDTSLRQASEAIGGIATELKDLPERLTVAAGSIREVGDAAAQQQVRLATKIEENGDEYIKSLSALATQNAEVESSLSTISSQIVAASESVAKASSAVDGNLDRLLTGIGELTHVAAETTRTVRESQEAVRGTIETLHQQMSLHIQRFDAVDEKLAGVFTSIGSHLELQSRQMGEQLTTMDQALARAVNQFEQLIDDLTETMGTRRAAE
jgi:chromosome segregation ATPase